MFERTKQNLIKTRIALGRIGVKSVHCIKKLYTLEITALLIVAGTIGITFAIYAAPNQAFVYQGRLTDANYVPVANGTYYVKLKIYSDPAGGSANCVWSTGSVTNASLTTITNNCNEALSTSTIQATVTHGSFAIALGDTGITGGKMPDISNLNFKTTTYYLGVTVCGTGADAATACSTSPTPAEMTPLLAVRGSVAGASIISPLLANTFNQVPGSYTQINDADGITATETSVTVDSTAGYPSAGTLEIDDGLSSATVSDNPLTAVATTIIVNSTTNYPSSGTLVVDKNNSSREVVTYTGKTATSFTGVTRGQLGTTAVTHTSGSALELFQELVTYTATTTTTFTGVTRGRFGTLATTHNDNATLKTYLMSGAANATTRPVFFITGDGNTFINSNAAGIDSQFNFQTSGATNYSLGIDHISGSNALKIRTSSAPLTGTGTILLTSGTTVLGSGTTFRSQLVAGSTITISGQTRTVTSIGGDITLFVDSAFSPEITSGTPPFTYTNPLLTLDARKTTSGMNAALFTGLNSTISPAANASYTTLTITPPQVTFSGSNTIAAQNAVVINQPTVIGGGNTITDSATMMIAGPPAQSTSGTFTNTYGLRIASAAVGSATNSYGLAIAAPTGATNNYAAQFMGRTGSPTEARVGIGTAAPITQLHIAGNVPSAALTSIASSIGEGTTSIFVQGRYAYITNFLASTSTNRFQVIDISNLGTAALATSDIIGSIATLADRPHYVFVRGRYAYVSQWDNGTNAGTLEIIDVSNPKTPVSVGSVSTGNQPLKLYVQGRYAYVVNRAVANNVQIFDVSNPVTPVLVGQMTANALPENIVVQGRYAYITTDNPSLQIIDVSNPAGPASPSGGASGIVATTGTPAQGISVQGSYAYVTSGPSGSANTLQIFKITDPASPTNTGFGSVSLDNDCRGISVQARYAYITCYGSRTFRIFDISYSASTSTTPISILNLTSSAVNDSPYPPFIQGRFAFIPLRPTGGASGGFQVFDIGGSYIQEIEAGGLEIASGQVRSDFTINNLLDVRGGVNVGLGGLFSAGPLTATGLNAASTASALDIRNSEGTNLLYVQNDGKIGLGVIAPSYDLSLSGSASRTIGMEAVAAGNGTSLTLRASNGTGTSVTGGTLVLSSGQSTGTATAKVQVLISQAGATSNTTGNAPATMFEFVNGHIAALALGTAPTASCNGNAATLASGSNDTAGRITIPASPGTLCILSFARSFASAPACSALYESATNSSSITVSSSSTSSVTFAFSPAPTVADTFSYFCVGQGSQ